jgi:hypothetical protein
MPRGCRRRPELFPRSTPVPEHLTISPLGCSTQTDGHTSLIVHMCTCYTQSFYWLHTFRKTIIFFFLLSVLRSYFSSTVKRPHPFSINLATFLIISFHLSLWFPNLNLGKVLSIGARGRCLPQPRHLPQQILIRQSQTHNPLEIAVSPKK